MDNVKILLLKNGGLTDYLIGRVTELDEEPSVFVEKCYAIRDDDMEPYPRYSKQRDLFLTSDSIFTIVDPNKAVLELYLDKEKSEPTTE